MEYTSHLYQILHPNPALVGSQYNPEQFAKHYNSGSTRFYDGKVIFAEIDSNFRHPFFAIDKGISQLIPHEDGRPKATKFISSYRVLEHMDFKALGNLYLTTPEGQCLELKESSLDYDGSEDKLRIFAEITPLRMLVLTDLDYVEFGKSITQPDNGKGAPRFLYTQLELNIETFLEEFNENPFMHTPIPGMHPSKLRDAILELNVKKGKHTKGLSLDCSFDKLPYKLIHRGFMFASQDEYKYYEMPPLERIEKKNYKFWRSM